MMNCRWAQIKTSPVSGMNLRKCGWMGGKGRGWIKRTGRGRGVEDLENFPQQLLMFMPSQSHPPSCHLDVLRILVVRGREPTHENMNQNAPLNCLRSPKDYGWVRWGEEVVGTARRPFRQNSPLVVNRRLKLVVYSNETIQIRIL